MLRIPLSRIFGTEVFQNFGVLKNFLIFKNFIGVFLEFEVFA